MAMPREQYKECMGILMGKNEESDVIVYDYVPINHGGKIEVNFAPEDYVAFSMVDSQFGEQGLFSVGWAHSHPGLDIFLSSVDVHNCLGWQTTNPLAIALVFDHTKLEEEGNWGFKIFRLNDVGQGNLTDFHELDWEIEEPDDLNIYKDGLKKLIDNLHGKLPVILEINEVPDVFGDLKLPGQNALRSKIPELDTNALIESFKRGMSELAEDFIAPLTRFAIGWSQEMTNKVVDGNVKILGSLSALREAMNKGMEKIVNWFKFQMDDKLNDVDIFIDDRFEALTNKVGSAMDGVKQLPTQLQEAINQIIAEKVDPQIQSLRDAVDEKLAALDGDLTALADVEKNAKEQEEGINGIASELATKKGELETELDEVAVKLQSLADEKIKAPLDELGDFRRDYGDVASTLKALTTVLQGIKEDVQKLQDAQANAGASGGE